MPKVIRSSLGKMTFILCLLLGMAYWQMDFVTTAITANVFLNSCILGTFAFGVTITFLRTYKLKNEFTSLRSLREDYEDSLNGAEQDDKDPMWRYYRCQTKAILFVTPKILERPYNILSEEIGRSGHLSVSTSVMQNLLDSVDEQLDDGKALGSYITGLLVFLGLIGTFVGLMVTLGSVGEIIGGLDLSGGTGTEAIQNLMSDLQIPLQGMATGFSSSLFGLITSLVLGLISLFSNQAAGALKSDFGTWLTGVAKVDGDAGSSNTQNSSSLSVESQRMLSVMYRVAKITLASNARVVNSVSETYENSTSILRNQLQTNEQFLLVSESLADVSNGLSITTEALGEVANQLESTENLSGVIKNLDHTVVKQEKSLKKVNENFTLLLSENKELLNRTSLTMETMSQIDNLEKSVERAQSEIDNGFASLHGSSEKTSTVLEGIHKELGEHRQHQSLTRNDLLRITNELRTDLSYFIDNSALNEIESKQDLDFKVFEKTSPPKSQENQYDESKSKLEKFFSRFKKRA
jgi:uncharacterized coiled-coil protein SlyX/biopolymer transport protein ExbB/TolQ